MSTPFIKCNGSVALLATPVVTYVTPPVQDILATDVIAVYPTTISINGTKTPCVCVLVGQNDTEPKQYFFNTTTAALFLTYINGLTVTHTLVSYSGCLQKNGQSIFGTTPTTVLMNQSLMDSGIYTATSNQTAFATHAKSKTYPKINWIFTGNQTSTGAAATVSISVPIAASPSNTDTLKVYVSDITGNVFTQVGSTLTVSGSPSQATIKAAVDALFNSNLIGFTFVGTLGSNIDVLAGTAPTKGSYYNGFKVRFVPTGTTFGASTVTQTFASGA